MFTLADFDPFIDKFGLLAQSDGDGGDSAQREGMFAAASSLLFQAGAITPRDFFAKTLRTLNRADDLVSESGLLRRHSDPSRWYSEYNRGSRDQYHIIIGLALMGARTQFMKLLKGHAKRLFLFASNTKSNGFPGRSQLPDFTGPGFWALWIRGLHALNGGGLSWTLPILTLFDLSLVAESLIRVYYYGHDKEESDCLNHVQALTLAHFHLATPMSKLAARIMRKQPKKFFPSSTVNGVQQEFDNYFGSNNGITPMAALWAPIIEEVIYKD